MSRQSVKKPGIAAMKAKQRLASKGGASGGAKQRLASRGKHERENIFYICP